MAETVEYHELTLPLGKILGAIRKTIYDTTYYSFDGIPYGEPPVGELRFKAPLPVKPWRGVRDCFEFQTKPVQRNSATGEIQGTEDCLYLNVYAKTLNSEKPLPVLVWIYGGAFSTGEATKNMYSPDYFMSEDIIVVTLNYRLSALGFLSVKDPALDIPGNAGLKDQILALKWVKQFIRYFNGDHKNITLAGNSAGSGSTHYLTATEQTNGLFHKAICMSGTVFNPWAVTAPEDHGYRLAKKHGYQGDNIDAKVVEYLRSLQPGQCVDHDAHDNGFTITFGPCIEPYDTEGCVIPAEPREMLKTAWGNEIPMIFSGTSDEGLVLYSKLLKSPQMLSVFKHNPERIVPLEVAKRNSQGKNLELAQKLLKVQFGDKDPAEASIEDILHYCGIKLFWHGIHRSLLSRLAYSKAPTYLYRFTFDSPTFNHLRRKFCGNDVKSGVSHADDISYLWYGNYSWKLEETSKEFKTIQKMVGIFVNFARNANVEIQRIALNDVSSDNPLIWQPLKASDPHQALDIGQVLEFTTIPEKHELKMWDTLYHGEELF